MVVRLESARTPLEDAIERAGAVPLPPYIRAELRDAPPLPDGLRRRAGLGRRADGRACT